MGLHRIHLTPRAPTLPGGELTSKRHQDDKETFFYGNPYFKKKNIYIYIPGTHLSFVLAPKQGLFQSKQGSFGFQVYIIYIYMGVSKNNGLPKMDGENHGSKPYEQMDDLGGLFSPLFLLQHPYINI